MVPRAVRIIRGKPPFIEGQGGVWHDERLIIFHLFAKPRAVRTGSVGIVKGKQTRLQLWNGDAAVRAGVFL